MATITLTVTVSNPGSGNKYYIDGALQATVSMIPGNTYKFDQADNSNSGHPLRLSTTSDGSHNSGSEYTTGVTTSGTPGSSGAYTQIEVTALTVQTLYYYCTAHSGMGGAINVGNSSTLGLNEMSGFAIQNLSSDSTSVGQIYYNSTSGSFKAVKDGGAPIGTWASGGSLNTARSQQGGAGTQTSALSFGGDTYPPSSGRVVAITESYNGTSYTEVADLNVARRGTTGAGASNTAAICAGGYTGTVYSGATETWNGSSWTAANALNDERIQSAVAGISTAALCFGGSPPGYSANTETWNGTSWTEVNNLNVAKKTNAAIGLYTAALSVGGNVSGGAVTNQVESWDGTSWTEIAEINTARTQGSGAGTQTLGLFFGGYTTTSVANTEAWDGTSWTEINDLATARYDMGDAGNGPSTATLGSGGYNTNKTAVTEEWNAADFEVTTLTTS